MRGAGGRPARRRWWDVTASGIWGGEGYLLEGGRLIGFREGRRGRVR